MGTNYYHYAKEPCECCGREYEPRHIGKQSAGWKFLFQSDILGQYGEPIKCVDDWRKTIASGGYIEAHSGSGWRVTAEQFWESVMNAQANPDLRRHSRAEYSPESYTDPEGFEMYNRDFS